MRYKPVNPHFVVDPAVKARLRDIVVDVVDVVDKRTDVVERRQQRQRASVGGRGIPDSCQ